MPALRVTALAKKRGAPREHARMVRSVRVMAVRAVLGYRRVLPQERTTFLRVTLEAGIVHALPHELQLRCRAVRAVTGGTGHFAFIQGVRIRFQRVAFAEGMTFVALVGLRRRPEHRIIGGVNLMTAGTADFIVVMRAAVPGEADIGFMTAEAHSVLYVDACRRVGGETYDRLSLLSAPDPAGMHATGTVAGFTLQLALTERTARICRHRVFRLEYADDCLITDVTGEAGIRAAAAIRYFGFV